MLHTSLFLFLLSKLTNLYAEASCLQHNLVLTISPKDINNTHLLVV